MDLFILFAAFLSSYVLAQDCSLTPIFIDFHDRSIDGGASIQYGLFAGVGTPSQNQSTWPSLLHNETIFTDAKYCEDSTYVDCDKETHGIYVHEISTSFQENSSYRALDSTQIRDASIEIVGTDTLNIFTHYFDPSPPTATRIEGFPVTVLSNYTASSSPWFGPSGQFGLGPSSTVLQRLFDQGAISSRSFALFVGSAYSRAGGAINGSLTLGGYDSGRFTDDVHNYTLATDYDVSAEETPFRVTIDKITLNHNDDANATTDLSTNPFDAYLTTGQFGLTLPADITASFVDLTSATPPSNPPDDQTQNYLSLPSEFQGSMIFTLSTGLSITISNSDLRNISDISPINASPLSSNRSQNETSTSSSSSLLGSLFLSQLYLIANYDSSPPTFHLTPADPHAKYVMTEPLCADTLPEPFKPKKISAFAASGMAGAIIGGVIGGIGLSFAVWWCCLRCMRRRYAKEQALSNSQWQQQQKGLETGNVSGATAWVPRTGSLLYKKGRGRANGKKLDKGKNPISFFRARGETQQGGGKYKPSPRSSDSDEEGFDMIPMSGNNGRSTMQDQNQSHIPTEEARSLNDIMPGSTDLCPYSSTQQSTPQIATATAVPIMNISHPPIRPRSRSVSPITPSTLAAFRFSNDEDTTNNTNTNNNNNTFGSANNRNSANMTTRKPLADDNAYTNFQNARALTSPDGIATQHHSRFTEISLAPVTIPSLQQQGTTGTGAGIGAGAGGLRVQTTFPPPPTVLGKGKKGGKLEKVGRKMFPG